MTDIDSAIEKLKPCPFCGNMPILHENDWCEPPEWHVLCGCQKAHAESKDAVSAWNCRSQQFNTAQPTEADVERVARKICLDRGEDPDEMTYHHNGYIVEPYGPAWCHHEGEAQAALRAVGRAGLLASSPAAGGITVTVEECERIAAWIMQPVNHSAWATADILDEVFGHKGLKLEENK